MTTAIPTVTASSPAFASASQAGEEKVDASAFSPPVESRAPAPEVPGVKVTFAHVLAGRQWLGGGDIIRPIRVQIGGTADGFVVSESETGIFGAGPDLPSALQDFRVALTDHLEVLEASKPLAEDLQRQLGFLRRHVRAA
jgi:hypothetical protein